MSCVDDIMKQNEALDSSCGSEYPMEISMRMWFFNWHRFCRSITVFIFNKLREGIFYDVTQH